MRHAQKRVDRGLNVFLLQLRKTGNGLHHFSSFFEFEKEKEQGPFILGARTLLGAPGIATRIILATRNKKLLAFLLLSFSFPLEIPLLEVGPPSLLAAGPGPRGAALVLGLRGDRGMEGAENRSHLVVSCS